MMKVITNLLNILFVTLIMALGAQFTVAQITIENQNEYEKSTVDIQLTSESYDLNSNPGQKTTEAISYYRLLNGIEDSGSLRDDDPEVIWSDGFEDPADWIIDGPDGFGPENGFSITDQSDGQITWAFMDRIDSETGGNYGLFQNGDPSNPATVLQDGPFTLTYADPIDISEIDLPAFQFNQFGARFFEIQAVQVSTDEGDSWTTIGDNFDITELTTGGGSPFPNPMARSYDIFPHIDEGEDEIWVRFLWDNDPENPNPEQQYVAYGWFVDDLKIVETPANVLEMEEAFYPPLSYATPEMHLPVDTFGFSCLIENNGGLTRSDVEVIVLVANIDTEEIVHQQTVVLESFEADTDSFVVFPETFAPELEAGNYVIEYSVGVPGEEEFFPGNTFIQTSFVVTEDIFAKNDPNANDFTSGTTRDDDNWYWGNMYFMSPDATEEERKLNSIELAFLPNNGSYEDETALVYILKQIEPGATMNFPDLNADSELPPNLHPQFEAVAAYIIETNELINAGAGQIFSISGKEMLDPNTFTPLGDEYIVMEGGHLYGAIVQHEGNGLLQPFSNIATYSTGVGILYIDNPQTGQKQYFSGFTDVSGPIVRMKIGETVSTSDPVAQPTKPMTVYPNPTSDAINIEFEMDKVGKFELNIIDITGKTVLSRTIDGQSNNFIQQDLRTFESGNYIIQVVAEDGVRISPLVITR